MANKRRMCIETRVLAERLKLPPAERKRYSDAYNLIQDALDAFDDAQYERHEESQQTLFAQFRDYTAASYRIVNEYRKRYVDCFEQFPPEQRLAEIKADVSKLDIDFDSMIEAFTADGDVFSLTNTEADYALEDPSFYEQMPPTLPANINADHVIHCPDYGEEIPSIDITLQHIALIRYGCYKALGVKPKQIAAITNAIAPSNYLMPNHKAVTAMTSIQDMFDPLTLMVNVASHKAKPVDITMVISYEGDDITLSGRQPFTMYDRSVYNAISSLYAAGNRYFTAAMVWRVMNGKTEQEKPTRGQLAAVTKSIEKMRFIRVQIDFTDEAKMRKMGDDIENAVYDSTLLHIDGAKLVSSKGTVKGYRLLSAPVLYAHSQRTGQLLSVPIDLLDIKKVKDGKVSTLPVPYTEQRVAIKTELLHRIEGMRGDNNLASHCIRFTDYTKNGTIHKGLYSIAGKPELSTTADAASEDDTARRKKAAFSVREDCKLILEYWAACGYIKGFTEYKEQKSIAGYRILL